MTITYLNGTATRRVFYGSTQQECKRQATAAQESVRNIVYSGELTVAAWVERWLAAHRRTGQLKPRTADFYEDHIRKYIIPGLGSVPLTELKSWQIQGWLDQQVDAGLGIPTVRGMWRTLRAALPRAKQMRVVSENEASGDFIVLPPHTPSAAKLLEVSDLSPFRDVLLSQAVDGRTHYECAAATALFVAMATGLRNAELIGLTWDDVTLPPDASAATLEVRRTLQRVRDTSAAPRIHTNGRMIRPKKWVVGPPKSNAGIRRLPLFPEAEALLRAERDRQRLAKWVPLPDGDLVFRTRFGKPLNDTSLAHRMRQVCAVAGIDYRSFYALRHTAASAAIAAGESDVSVAQFLGHSDSSTTKRIYARAFEEHSVDRMTKMRAFLLGEPPLREAPADFPRAGPDAQMSTSVRPPRPLLDQETH